MTDKIMKFLYVSFVLLILQLPIMVFTMNRAVYGESSYYDVYAMTAPFGFFSISGEFSGGLFHFNGEIRGTENYDVKYFKDGVLKTVVCDSQITDVIVDGTLRLERIEVLQTYYLGFWLQKDHVKYIYKIHIPYLPEHEPISEDWR